MAQNPQNTSSKPAPVSNEQLNHVALEELSEFFKQESIDHAYANVGAHEKMSDMQKMRSKGFR